MFRVIANKEQILREKLLEVPILEFKSLKKEMKKSIRFIILLDSQLF